MPMLVDREGVRADGWAVVQGDAAPPDGPAILPFDRLAEATGRDRPTGVALPNDADPAALAPRFADLDLIAVAFPAFSDGRGFSIGRKLRELGYAGRLRASGPVIADQFAYLLECGFDEAAVPDDVAARQPVDRWLEQLSRITLGYQRGRPGVRASILDRRRA